MQYPKKRSLNVIVDMFSSKGKYHQKFVTKLTKYLKNYEKSFSIVLTWLIHNYMTVEQ